MKEAAEVKRTADLTRLGMIAVAVVAALVLTVVLVVAQEPNFDDSYKSGPAFADTNEVITYTLVVINTGDPVQDVVLSDTLPSGVTLLTCSVITETGGTTALPDCDPDELWVKDFDTGDRVTTTVTVQVNVGTLQFPLINEAHIGWPAGQMDLGPVTTIVNPFKLFLPLIAKSFG